MIIFHKKNDYHKLNHIEIIILILTSQFLFASAIILLQCY